ncbi:restriction endonuclease [Paenibacillus sp. p3-SID1389]|uniref:restriction endonuclease n=1 Tax=Paenibacillus sp. p3-SID1389 TaxID=2916364 RepID=UPI0021A42999|nr:restriction endonuclease [Paenibacillus sp. p3-SID1389]MCT2196126.1 restriction endonuclease [Paenibacillus sp. p3-SID1389]
MGNNYSSEIRTGDVLTTWNSSGTRILKYSVEMYHKGLNEHKLISAPEPDILQNKVKIQAKKWNEKWSSILHKRQLNQEKEASIEEAARRTEEATNNLIEIDNLLLHTLSVDDTVDWDSLKRNDHYPINYPEPRIKKVYPEKPREEAPSFSLIDIIIKSRKQKKLQESTSRYSAMLMQWEEQKKSIDEYNQSLEREYEQELQEWEQKKNEFLKEQEEYNKKIDELKELYFKHNVDSVVEYCDMVLNNSEYPESFPKDYELEYNPDTKILVVEYQLPSIECFPTLKEVKYVASRKELKEFYISESQVQKMFDEAMYKITLRTLHEIFESDVANAVEAISFNGWVKTINKATGREEINCILSIQVKKDQFVEIDLANVDPKVCFRNLKGVAGSKLSALTPVQPILQINKSDKRFVESYEVANQIDATTNLAAMDWEDFEHLIRELFEKEFQTTGGEVKVTQASRDGGVDAIAFDPDPIRGGKIIIQAKRYTNTVSVSAVRDLYGSVVNEGATKGILVSTADYGPDAYEFAKGKPLTLLNGSNLLHLLEKHGHHAKIDLKEAKKILADKAKG